MAVCFLKSLQGYSLDGLRQNLNSQEMGSRGVAESSQSSRSL